MLESISSRCNTNFCPQVVLAIYVYYTLACLSIFMIELRNALTTATLEVRAGQIPGLVREYSYFPDPSFPLPRLRITEGSGNQTMHDLVLDLTRRGYDLTRAL